MMSRMTIIEKARKTLEELNLTKYEGLCCVIGAKIEDCQPD